MAAQAALHATCFPATTKLRAASKASIPSESMSFLQFWRASKFLKESRLTCSPPNTSVTKVTGVAFATSSGQMERSVSIRFKDEATVTSEPFDEKQLKVIVSLTSVGTRKAFEVVLENLRRSAPAVPGFRMAKGGKSVIPRDVLYQMLGPSRVDSFVVKEIVSSSVLEYVEKEGFKVKKDFKTVQSDKELVAQFKAGKEFVFEAILSLEDVEAEIASVEES
ncbi:hypothetical protein GOP47_0000771 [Adiantum capillus-veneris]|uniref:peptidylprolyl isomerase n=1 Tax=Adiantum capillus-veneris TaxID=13818 RepID=A0A9D4VE52_ADICA|nr:hypothetical protein GOP47_0000771 [Adiantum capillus-veneris]